MRQSWREDRGQRRIVQLPRGRTLRHVAGMGWIEFSVALLAFYLAHLLPGLAPQLRAWPRFHLAYGLASLALLVWVIAAAGRAPVVLLWDQAGWMRWLVNLAMPVAILLICLALGAVNPLSFGGRSQGFDPARPGLAGVVRHPLLWALLIWAGAHALVNGDLAHVILFGGFAAYALVGMWALDARKARDWGRGMWVTRASGTSNIPFRGNWRSYRPAPMRMGLAVLIWAALWHLHLPVIGASPHP